ncbi:MAG TPA: hypothetical protein VJY62_19970 [Bacteroidia bacterium]|nr:hypothetical protein [Bacteroidia bacterium]
MPLNNWITVEKIDSIASLADPVIRNLQITQCYCMLFTVFANRMGEGANWCTFATWASKQAGQTIRREDLQRSLENLVKNKTGMEAELSLVVDLALKAGAKLSHDIIRKDVLTALINSAASQAGNAVARGNKKVFEEIAREFSLFINACCGDAVYEQKNIDSFCAHLGTGPPPSGQEYLRRGFSAYYTAFFESDPVKKTQLNLFANLCVGFHEQTRLQPEIAEALNASLPPLKEIKSKLSDQLFPGLGLWTRLLLFLQSLFRITTLFDKAIESLVQRMQMDFRKVITAHMMTLTLPPGKCMQLGSDLSMPYPENLIHLAYPDLLDLLTKVDPSTDSTVESGATDWANLAERMHYIADLFRCCHDYKNLFDNAFTTVQTEAIMNGTVPAGKL